MTFATFLSSVGYEEVYNLDGSSGEEMKKTGRWASHVRKQTIFEER
jgi:hypothetical protein